MLFKELARNAETVIQPFSAHFMQLRLQIMAEVVSTREKINLQIAVR